MFRTSEDRERAYSTCALLLFILRLLLWFGFAFLVNIMSPDEEVGSHLLSIFMTGVSKGMGF